MTEPKLPLPVKPENLPIYHQIIRGQAALTDRNMSITYEIPLTTAAEYALHRFTRMPHRLENNIYELIIPSRLFIATAVVIEEFLACKTPLYYDQGYSCLGQIVIKKV